ncbi:MAG: FAD-binding oxidoreductase [Deltaproteobacteria bacterium]|nr:FAD-binding oxidoreductase [Deltaproteobacteria bacterium]
MATLKELQTQTPLIYKDNPSIGRYAEDTMMRGSPDAVLQARDLQEIREALQFCHAHKIPVTFCGSQTSMTGASVATEGLLISTERLDKVLDVGTRKEKGYAITQPGVTITELKKTVAAKGWFYPPAPTSQDDARIGATVSTNASGEDSFQYGTTRKYIREIKILLSDGTDKILSRKADEHFPDEPTRAGYFPHGNNPLDLFIGGEGTLGFIHEVTVDLVPQPPGYFSALAPFPDPASAVDFAIFCVTEGRLKTRALELIDTQALHYMKTHPTFPKSLEGANALIYFKQEYEDEGQFNSLLTDWMAAIEKFSTPALSETILVATTDKQKEEMRQWRHQIPARINEEWRRFWPVGGGKVGSDWWVPIPKLKEMMGFVYKTGAELGVPFMAYAHIGRGHPHVNYLCKTSEEKKRAEATLIACCQKAVSLGGGVTGEHGVGKLHRNLLPIQWGQDRIDWMVRVKKEWDPEWILGRGNILKPH